MRRMPCLFLFSLVMITLLSIAWDALACGPGSRRAARRAARGGDAAQSYGFAYDAGYGYAPGFGSGCGGQQAGYSYTGYGYWPAAPATYSVPQSAPATYTLPPATAPTSAHEHATRESDAWPVAMVARPVSLALLLPVARSPEPATPWRPPATYRVSLPVARLD
jgi:hypothetical protein